MEGPRRRSTLSDQMSAVDDRRSLAGYTLDDVLANNKRLRPPALATARAADIRSRTLLDIIRDEEPGASKGLFGHKDKRTWKSFRDKLRLKRAGSAWVSTVPIPTSDIPFQSKRSLLSKRNQVRFHTVSTRNAGELTRNATQNEESSKSPPAPFCRPQTSRQSSTLNSSKDSIASDSTQHDNWSENSPAPDAAPVGIIRPQISRHNSVQVSNAVDDYTDPTEPERDNRIRHISTTLSEERTLSAREAVAAQEAADAASAAAEAAEEKKEEEEEDDENEESTRESGASEASQPVRMSLMDLLQETDRELGLEGSSYAMGDENDDEEYYEDEEEEDDEQGKGGESNCCVCMVGHKGAALIPCGHTFCRLCSKELMVGRGNCPTCNGFIFEILHVF